MLPGWRLFAARRYRPFHGIAAGQALVGALVGEAIYIPLLLALGAGPVLTAGIATLPIFGSSLVGALPTLLRRNDGNLRGLTLLFALGECRGLLLALVALGAAAGLSPILAIAAVAVVVAVGQTAGITSGASLGIWGAVVLADGERRLVIPRLGALSALLSAILLLPAAALVDLTVGPMGVVAYAVLFATGGLGGLLIAFFARRLPAPGRVRVPAGTLPELDAPKLRRFRQVATWNALGFGLMPYLSIYAISVLGFSAGFTMLMAAAAALAGLAASTSIGGFLARGSASRVLRASYALRAGAAASVLLAFPGNPVAASLLLGAVVAHAFGGAAGTLAHNERLFRLASGPGAVQQQARLSTYGALANGGGQLLTSAVIGLVGPFSYLAYAPMLALSAAARGVAAARSGVGPSWISSTGVWHLEDLHNESTQV